MRDMRILFLEDEPTIREVLTEYMKMQNYDVTCAGDGGRFHYHGFSDHDAPDGGDYAGGYGKSANDHCRDFSGGADFVRILFGENCESDYPACQSRGECRAGGAL